MSHEERNTVSALIVSVIVLLYFGTSLRNDWAAGAFDGTDGIMIWARTVLWIIPFCIVFTIVATIAVNIGYAVVTKTSNPDFISDERDAAIGRRGSLVTMIIASMGFIAALIALAVGWSALAGFNVILAAFYAADFAGNMSKMAAYRFGI